jgi:excisionase family DNA binding protein
MKDDLSILKTRINETKTLLDLIEKKLETIDLVTKETPEQGEPGYLTVNEACKYLNVSRSTFYSWRNEVTVPSFKILGRELFKKEELDQALEATR